MRDRLQYKVGPAYTPRPFGRRRPGVGLSAQLLTFLWSAVAFLMRLVVWPVLLVAGVVYTIICLLPLECLAVRRDGRTFGSRPGAWARRGSPRPAP